MNNQPLFTGESLNLHLFSQRIGEKLGVKKVLDNSDAVFINIAKDKMLIPAIDNYGEQVGVGCITDREKLCEFLSILKKCDNYKYIILDVAFDVDDKTCYDDSLFRTIASIARIAVATDGTSQYQPAEIINKTALAEYYSTITESNFTRSEFLRDTIPYLPLKVYQDLNPDNRMKRYGKGFFSFFTCDGKPCYNSLYLTFDSSSFPQSGHKILDTETGEDLEYYYMGKDIIESFNDSIYTQEEALDMTKSLFEDKYVVVGDFEDDVHNTYMGEKPGSYILYRAIKSLNEGKHYLSFWILCIWTIVFSLISFMILKGLTWTALFNKINFTNCCIYKWLQKRKCKIKRYIISTVKVCIRVFYMVLDLCSIAILMQVTEIVLYMITAQVYSLVLPAICFYIITYVSDRSILKNTKTTQEQIEYAQ